MGDEDDKRQEFVQRNTKRRKQQLVFDEDGYAEGWSYKVPKAFRPALDVVFSTRVRTKTLPDGSKTKQTYQEWTEGDPPLFAFREYDLVASREIAFGSTNRFVAQIGHSEPDSLEGRVIAPGTVGFRLFEWLGGHGGSYSEIGWYSCSQAEFVAFLMSGVVPAKQRSSVNEETE